MFVDVGSFERLREGEPWVGYRQFCMLYLYPLLLQAVKGVEPHAFLRGSIDGITPAQMRGMCSFRDRFRKGFYLNVFLHAKLEKRHGDRGSEVKAEVKKAGFKKELIAGQREADAQAGRRASTGARRRASGWPTASATATPTTTPSARTSSCARCRPRERWGLTWDIGRNNGRYSRIAAEGSDRVLAVDADQGPVELLHRTLQEEGDEQILTLTMNLADPSPGPRLARGRAQGRCPTAGSPTSCLPWR